MNEKETITTTFQMPVLDKHWWKTFALMLISVIMMGLGVSLLVLTEMGTDPCSAMNYGIARTLGLSFGNYQLLFNTVLLILVILLDWRLIGTGTIGNMVVVGYSADFFGWVWTNVCHVPAHLPLAARIGILVPALLLFVVAAACYMHSGHGMAPYDAVPFAVTEKIRQKTGRNCFKPVRLSIDLIATILGFLTGGEVGVMTVLMVLLLAPIVEFVGKLFGKMGCRITTPHLSCFNYFYYNISLGFKFLMSLLQHFPWIQVAHVSIATFLSNSSSSSHHFNISLRFKFLRSSPLQHFLSSICN